MGRGRRDDGASATEITPRADRRVTVEILTADELWERWLAQDGEC